MLAEDKQTAAERRDIDSPIELPSRLNEGPTSKRTLAHGHRQVLATLTPNRKSLLGFRISSC